MKNILQIIGNTPLVKLTKIKISSSVEIWLKLESFNPGGSIKDRVAMQMISDAEKSGELKEGMTIIEASSGNTGIGLSMVGAVKGYSVTIVVSRSVGKQKEYLMKKYGAKVIRDNKAKTTGEAIRRVKDMLKQKGHNYWYANQHENLSNPRAHRQTAREILTKVPKLTHLVGGVGTTGTLLGTSRHLKKYVPRVQTVAVFPKNNESIAGLRKRNDEIPLWNEDMADMILHIANSETEEVSRRLAVFEGILVGQSGAVAVAAAEKVSKNITNGKIVAIIPDGKV